MGFGDTAKFRFPIAVADHPVDMTLARIGLRARAFRGREIDIARRSGWVIRIKDRFDGTVASEGERNRGLDALTGHIRDLLIKKLRRVGPAGAAQIAAVKP